MLKIRVMLRSGLTFLPVMGLLCFFMMAATVWGQQRGEAEYSRGLNMFALGDYNQAFDNFTQACRANPNDPRPIYYQGICQARLNGESVAIPYYQKAALVEMAAKGGTYDIGKALQRVQGVERLTLENVRKQVRDLWRKLNAEAQTRLYGETLNKEKERLSVENRIAGSDSAGASAPAPASRTASQSGDLPAVAPIAPLTKEERDVVKIPDLYNIKDEDFVHFRDELGRTTLSTAEEARQKELESRVVYKDPMDKPAKDGSRFVNIYDPREVNRSEDPFFGKDDPDDMYRDYENGPLPVTIAMLESYTGKKADRNVDKGKKKGGRNGMDGNPMDSSMDGGMGMSPDQGMTPPPDMSMGMEGQPGGQGQAQSLGDTGTLFKSDVANPNSADKMPDHSTDDIGLFTEDAKFSPPKLSQGNDPNSMGPGSPSGPEGSPSGM